MSCRQYTTELIDLYENVIEYWNNRRWILWSKDIFIISISCNLFRIILNSNISQPKLNTWLIRYLIFFIHTSHLKFPRFWEILKEFQIFAKALEENMWQVLTVKFPYLFRKRNIEFFIVIGCVKGTKSLWHSISIYTAENLAIRYFFIQCETN